MGGSLRDLDTLFNLIQATAGATAVVFGIVQVRPFRGDRLKVKVQNYPGFVHLGCIGLLLRRPLLMSSSGGRSTQRGCPTVATNLQPHASMPAPPTRHGRDETCGLHPEQP